LNLNELADSAFVNALAADLGIPQGRRMAL